MRRRSRTRRVLKWASTALCVLILMTFIVSLRQQGRFSSGTWIIAVIDGRIVLMTVPRGFPRGWEFYPSTQPVRKLACWPSVQLRPPYAAIVLPFWMILAALVIPTGFLWWRDRSRIRPGHCQNCGYDLTGNVSGRCPECGTPVPGTFAEGESA